MKAETPESEVSFVFYKKCDKCTNKTCIKERKMCESMERWIKKYVEVAQQHKVMNRWELERYNNLTQGTTTERDE